MAGATATGTITPGRILKVHLLFESESLIMSCDTHTARVEPDTPDCNCGCMHYIIMRPYCLPVFMCLFAWVTHSSVAIVPACACQSGRARATTSSTASLQPDSSSAASLFSVALPKPQADEPAPHHGDHLMVLSLSLSFGISTAYAIGWFSLTGPFAFSLIAVSLVHLVVWLNFPKRPKHSNTTTSSSTATSVKSQRPLCRRV